MSAPMNRVFMKLPMQFFIFHQNTRWIAISPLLMKRSRIEKINKLLQKKKKKFYFDVNNTSQFRKVENKASRKPGRMEPEDSVRLRCLNDNLFQHICDLINSNEISKELENLNVLLLGVRLTGDLSTCRVYWQASGDVDSDDKVQEVLDKHAFTLRHMLASLKVLHRSPIIIFMRDKASANTAEIDRLLAEADMGSSDSEVEGVLPSVTDMPHIHVHSQHSLNFLNMDLGKINQEIEKYKKKSKNSSEINDDFTDEQYTDIDISKSFEQFKVLQRKKKKRKERKTNPISASYNEQELDFDNMSLEEQHEIEEDDDEGLYISPEDRFSR